MTSSARYFFNTGVGFGGSFTSTGIILYSLTGSGCLSTVVDESKVCCGFDSIDAGGLEFSSSYKS